MSKQKTKRLSFDFKIMPGLVKRAGMTYEDTVLFEGGKEVSGPFTIYYLFLWRFAFMLSVFSPAVAEQISKKYAEMLEAIFKDMTMPPPPKKEGGARVLRMVRKGSDEKNPNL